MPIHISRLSPASLWHPRVYYLVPIHVYGMSPASLWHPYAYYLVPIHVSGLSPPSLWHPCVYYVVPIHMYGMSPPERPHPLKPLLIVGVCKMLSIPHRVMQEQHNHTFLDPITLHQPRSKTLW